MCHRHFHPAYRIPGQLGYAATSDGQLVGARFHDDNAVIGLAFLDAYEQSHDLRYHSRALETHQLAICSGRSSPTSASWAPRSRRSTPSWPCGCTPLRAIRSSARWLTGSTRPSRSVCSQDIESESP